MNARQIELMRHSWAQVQPIADTAATLFYSRLFELDPQLQPLFAHADMAEQRRKLMQVLAVVVNGIDRLETLLPAVQALGRRHVDYRVRDEHYQTVGAALLWTLEQGLGEGFTPEVRETWTAAYTVLATVMQQAAREAAAPLAAAA